MGCVYLGTCARFMTVYDSRKSRTGTADQEMSAWNHRVSSPTNIIAINPRKPPIVSLITTHVMQHVNLRRSIDVCYTVTLFCMSRQRAYARHMHSIKGLVLGLMSRGAVRFRCVPKHSTRIQITGRFANWILKPFAPAGYHEAIHAAGKASPQ